MLIDSEVGLETSQYNGILSLHLPVTSVCLILSLERKSAWKNQNRHLFSERHCTGQFQKSPLVFMRLDIRYPCFHFTDEETEITTLVIFPESKSYQVADGDLNLGCLNQRPCS